MRRIIGRVHTIAIGLTVCFSLLSIMMPQIVALAGASCLLALVTAFPLVGRSSRTISLILVSLSALALAMSISRGYSLELGELLNVNQDIVAMLAAVSLLGPVAQSEKSEKKPRLRGAPAVWRTSALTNFLSGVINLSAVTVTADYLHRGSRGLDVANVQIITRSFAAAAMWSPLWAGAAMALALVPDARIPVVVFVGMLLAATTLSLSMITVFRSLGGSLPTYTGYALSWSLLRMPLTMLISVLALHFAFPTVPVPRFVALSALGVFLVWAIGHPLKRVPRRLVNHANQGFSSLTSEASLFVSAGLLAVGLNALTAILDITLPMESFTVVTAWFCVLAMAVGAVLGVHQVISIGVIASLILPLHPDPTLFMSTVTIGWALATAIGPISGLQMYLQGRYRVPVLVTLQQNLPFLVTVLVLAWPALYLSNVLG